LDYTTLGRTRLKVSVAGLGCGGHSRLGQTQGASTGQSVRVVERAIELGINFIDTAAAYGTEKIVGEAIAGRRESVVLSSKGMVSKDFTSPTLISEVEFFERLDASLARLRTDYIDVYHLHGVTNDQLEHATAVIVPAMMKAREQGKIRFLGITERFGGDTRHMMLQRALKGDVWDVMMVGFNLLNPSARRTVFPVTREKQIGVLDMFAVRKALSTPKSLDAALAKAVAAAQLDRAEFDKKDPLGFLREHADSIVEAAYRFCRHEAGVDVVLTGTGSVDHLDENVRSINKPPLPAPVLDRLVRIFGKVDCLSGE
jgi:L-galactose dehydrogenase